MKSFFALCLFFVSIGAGGLSYTVTSANAQHASHAAAATTGSAATTPGASAANTSVTMIPDVTISLRTSISGGKLVFIGNTGNIADVVNPDLKVPEGAVVQINLTNDDGAIHDIAVPEFGAKSDNISGKGSATAIVFRAHKNGVFEYLCTLPGHKAAGMVGKIIVGEPVAADTRQFPQIAHDPANVGEPVGDSSTYRFWTFNNKVPGPMVRVRVGDTVTVNVTNAKESSHIHSVDFHAVTGPGGGAAVTQVAPGQTKSFTFKAMHPGLFVYHCATPMVAQHITNGMYGMILVEPEGGLPKVDREFYIMQGELYTAQPHGTSGLQEFSLEKLLAENPEHLMFNGSMDALTKIYDMKSNVGDVVRIYFGVGGPNLASSVHLIGEVFDRVYKHASLTSAPLTDVQTTLVPPGGATMLEFKTDYPGRYVLVDHALSRMEKGLTGILTVEGKKDDSIFHSSESIDASSGH